jgi:histidinol-phosphate aminotransferase
VSKYWNARTKGLSPYIPGEQPRQQTFIKLNTNENPYPPSPDVFEAIAQAADEGLRRYPDPAATELREAVAERYGVKPAQVFSGNGSDEVLAFAFAAFFEREKRGKKVLFPDITYSFYPVYARLWDVPYRCPPLKADFSLDPADYMPSLEEPCGGIVFPNPNAPTGRALPAATVLAIAVHNAEQVVIVDEAYAAFAEKVSAVAFIEKQSNILTVHTLSKGASLAGLRVGFAIGGEELIAGLCRVRDSFNSYPLDRLALAGACAALRDAPYYEAINQKIIATRERVSTALRAMDYEVIPSQANFIFIRSLSWSGSAFFSQLREAGILVRHFNQPRIADFLRVSIGSDEEMDVFLTVCDTVRCLTPVQKCLSP